MTRPSTLPKNVVTDWTCPRCEQRLLVVRWQAEAHSKACHSSAYDQKETP